MYVQVQNMEIKLCLCYKCNIVYKQCRNINSNKSETQKAKVLLGVLESVMCDVVKIRLKRKVEKKSEKVNSKQEMDLDGFFPYLRTFTL